MVETHESFHAFTAATGLGAKIPDSLATCNAVEPGSAVAPRLSLREATRTRKFT